MKPSTRFTIIATALILCSFGFVIAHSSRTEAAVGETDFESIDFVAMKDGYQFATSNAQPKLTFQELKAIIRKDPTAKQQRGKIEFGSVHVEQGTALAEVMFISDDGRVLPFLYKLLPQRNSWKIVNVQRIWYVPRSHLLRGVRA
jgi:hypothetical protein